MYRSHFALYFGTSAVAYSLVLILGLVTNLAVLPHVAKNPKQMQALSVLFSMVNSAVATLPIAIGIAALIAAVAANYLGQTMTIRQAYAAVRKRWVRCILIPLVAYFYALTPVMLACAATAIVFVAVPAGSVRFLAVGVMVLLIVAAFAFAFLLALHWALAIPGAMLEDLKIHPSLKRSYALTKGSLGRIFVMLLLVGVVMMIVQYAVLIPLLFLTVKNHGAITLASRILTPVSSFLSGSIVMPIIAIALTLFYYDQRIRKEGYDVQWLIEQTADSTTPAPASAGPVVATTLPAAPFPAVPFPEMGAITAQPAAPSQPTS